MNRDQSQDDVADGADAAAAVADDDEAPSNEDDDDVKAAADVAHDFEDGSDNGNCDDADANTVISDGNFDNSGGTMILYWMPV